MQTAAHRCVLLPVMIQQKTSSSLSVASSGIVHSILLAAGPKKIARFRAESKAATLLCSWRLHHHHHHHRIIVVGVIDYCFLSTPVRSPLSSAAAAAAVASPDTRKIRTNDSMSHSQHVFGSCAANRLNRQDARGWARPVTITAQSCPVHIGVRAVR
jgi:hypothetical protein